MNLYYECHITIEPVFDNQLEQFRSVCNGWDFKVAKLLMQKTLNNSDLDSFCTGHHDQYPVIYGRMIGLLGDLKEANFKIRRYKIESVILDSKNDDKDFKL